MKRVRLYNVLRERIGLFQAITCNNVIGWRDEVRKVIIFITDEDTHFALDGKLGGLIRPQDNECSTGTDRNDPFQAYRNELKQDYPSFGQIRDQLNDKNMVVIFAVHEYMDAIYRELSKFIQGTENIGHLKRDPSSLQVLFFKHCFRYSFSNTAVGIATFFKHCFRDSFSNVALGVLYRTLL